MKISNAIRTIVSNSAMVTIGCAVDVNGDGAVDFSDYLDFVQAFSIGC